jgi:pSer/pThr/pTyr-binding forkhead associated (FHA) protein
MILIQRVAGRNLTLTQISRDLLRIGRGTNQDLRSENPAVALEHALIELDAAGYLITDKGSITGTYVNGKPVETARLGRGDSIEIGDLRLDVQVAERGKPLFLRVEPVRVAAALIEEEEAPPESAAPGAQVVRARRFDYAAAYRLHRVWLTKASVTALVLIVALAVIGEVIEPERQRAFMPGGLSSAHARFPKVASDCHACHTPWNSVTSAKCMDCHAHPPHARLARSEPDCFACHAEHRGATKLAAIRDDTCTACHANLAAHVKTPPADRASLRFGGGRYDFAAIARIDVFDGNHPELTYPPDPNSLRFNHNLHLAPKGIFNAQGKREVLACRTCHALVAGRGRSDPAPIDFEQHCQRCHKLTFDLRFPNSEVPHGGDPGIVYGFIVAMVSGDRELAGKPAAEVRRILTTRTRVSADQRAVVAAEQVIKTRCRLCHEVQRQGSRLAVTPPVIPLRWLTHARFTHGRHTNVDCEKCHARARQSVPTSDVLMPRRADCVPCHGGSATSQASSACVSCHEYHFRAQTTLATAPAAADRIARAGAGGLGSGGRMLQYILLAAVVILLLVVLVPVGIALYQRMRPERAAAPPKPRPAPPAPVPQTPRPKPFAEKTTDKLERQPPPDLVPPVAEAPPPPPPAPLPATTRIPAFTPAVTVADVPVPPEERVSGGTEMMQWYGMLHCTSGPLEGQRFIIEDEGFYIGRDASLAKIVIPDSRISKRHLRIVPRDGRVWAIDEGSTNGTFLKGQRVSEVQLKRGDTLVLGDNAATFVYQI